MREHTEPEGAYVHDLEAGIVAAPQSSAVFQRSPEHMDASSRQHTPHGFASNGITVPRSAVTLQVAGILPMASLGACRANLCQEIAVSIFLRSDSLVPPQIPCCSLIRIA